MLRPNTFQEQTFRICVLLPPVSEFELGFVVILTIGILGVVGDLLCGLHTVRWSERAFKLFYLCCGQGRGVRSAFSLYFKY